MILKAPKSTVPGLLPILPLLMAITFVNFRPLFCTA